MEIPDPGSAPATTPPPVMARRVLASFNSSSMGVSIGFAVTAAVVLNPVFSIPFLVLLGRTLFLSMCLLIRFMGAQRFPERWLPRWLPRWLFAVLAVG